MIFFHQLSPKTLIRVIPNQGHVGVHANSSMNAALDDLWQSLEAIFTASLWHPESIPEISTTHDDSPEYDHFSTFERIN